MPRTKHLTYGEFSWTCVIFISLFWFSYYLFFFETYNTERTTDNEQQTDPGDSLA